MLFKFFVSIQPNQTQTLANFSILLGTCSDRQLMSSALLQYHYRSCQINWFRVWGETGLLELLASAK